MVVTVDTEPVTSLYPPYPLPVLELYLERLVNVESESENSPSESKPERRKAHFDIKEYRLLHKYHDIYCLCCLTTQTKQEMFLKIAMCKLNKKTVSTSS